MQSSNESSSIAQAIREFEPELIAIRRDIHQHPELAFQEFRTSQLVAQKLSQLQLEPRRGVGRTGVVADVVGAGSGPTVLLRADMDALPIEEEQPVEYRSTVFGVMHACGHDVHTAALLGAARVLQARRQEFGGRVRLVFQPAEELLQGAAAMLEDGMLEGVDMAIAGHVFAGFPVGTVVRRCGPMMAGADLFEITIGGKAAHGGTPQNGVNPIVAATQLLAAIPAFVTNETPPGEHLVISVTSIEAGRAANVVPDALRMRGSVRWYDEQLRGRILQRFLHLGQGICTALRASFSLKVTASVPVTMNAERLLPAVDRAIEQAGARAVDAGRRGASEDFALIGTRVPSFYMGIGAGGLDSPPHHCSAFAIDERSVALMAEILAGAALQALAG
jgi:amidohydrolase